MIHVTICRQKYVHDIRCLPFWYIETRNPHVCYYPLPKFIHNPTWALADAESSFYKCLEMCRAKNTMLSMVTTLSPAHPRP